MISPGQVVQPAAHSLSGQAAGMAGSQAGSLGACWTDM